MNKKNEFTFLKMDITLGAKAGTELFVAKVASDLAELLQILKEGGESQDLFIQGTAEDIGVKYVPWDPVDDWFWRTAGQKIRKYEQQVSAELKKGVLCSFRLGGSVLVEDAKFLGKQRMKDGYWGTFLKFTKTGVLFLVSWTSQLPSTNIRFIKIGGRSLI